jgi:poly(3-hydroxybutyrate) depolymerase
MLYQLYDWQRRILDPVSTWAKAGAEAFSSPYSPLSYSPFARRVSAGYDLLHRLGKSYDKPGFGITQVVVDGTTVPVSEAVVSETPFCRLLRFERHFPEGMRRPESPMVLVFAPLSGHHSTLLRDTVRTLLRDFEVAVTDWTDARLVPLSHGTFTLDDYVHTAMDFIRVYGPQVHLVSVCQPTVPVLGAVSLLAAMDDPAQPRSMTMMGGPIDTRRSPTQVNDLAQRRSMEWFRSHVIFKVPSSYPGYLRSVYPGFLQYAGFVAMNPGRHIESHWDYYLQLVRGDRDDAQSHRQFYDEYNAVMDLPAEYYLDTIHTVFQEQLLPRGQWMVRGERVAPESIRRTALFTIEGELDDISGSGQTEAAHALCSGIPAAHKQHLTATGVGHYGIFSGRRWRENIAPGLAEFIRRHDIHGISPASPAS